MEASFIGDRQKSILINFVLPGLALALTLFFAFYHLSASPAVWYDEGFFEQLAMNVAAGGAQAMELSPGVYLSSWSISAGYPLIYPMAALFSIFDPSVLVARIVPAIYLVLFVITSYFFVRRQFSATHAAIAALLLSTFPLLYGNGRSVLGEVPALFWFTLGLIALQSLERSGYRSVKAAAASGLCLGLALAAKFTFMLIAPAALIVLILRWKDVRTMRLGTLFAGLIGFLITFGIWLMLQFGPGDSLATTLTFFVNPYNYGEQTIWSVIFANVLRFFTEATPFYFLVLFVPWKLSLFLRFLKKETIPLPELFAYVFSVFVILAYLRTDGWYRYFFPAFALTLLFVPSAVSYLLTWLSRFLPALVKFRSLPVIGFALLILLQGYQTGFHSYVAQYYQSTRTSELETYFHALPPSETVFLYNVPEIAIFLPGNTYYQFVMPHETQPFGKEALPLLASGTPDIAVVNTETYENDPAPFVAYQIKDRVSHYLVLTRK